MTILFESAPDFDQPLAVLRHCHDRIRKQNATLGKLVPHLQMHGADQEAQKAAQAVLKYFQIAAPLHHDDEEIDLLPVLVSIAQNNDLILLKKHVSTILSQHEQMASMWKQLELQLAQIASGSASFINEGLVQEFQNLYQEHMHIEETQIAPMAMRLMSTSQMLTLGKAMQQRRGIA